MKMLFSTRQKVVNAGLTCSMSVLGLQQMTRMQGPVRFKGSKQGRDVSRSDKVLANRLHHILLLVGLLSRLDHRRQKLSKTEGDLSSRIEISVRKIKPRAYGLCTTEQLRLCSMTRRLKVEMSDLNGVRFQRRIVMS